MGYVFIIIGLICLVFILFTFLNTILGKILLAGIGVILLIKLVKFIKGDYKYWFRVTKKSVILAILVLICTVFLSEVMLANASHIIKKLVYLIGIVVILYLQHNETYQVDKNIDDFHKREDTIKKKIEEMKQEGTYEDFQHEQAKLHEKYQELQNAIEEFQNSSDEEFKISWVKQYQNQIKINPNRKGSIVKLSDISSEKIRMEIVDYAKSLLSVEGIQSMSLTHLSGTPKNAYISLPIKIIEAYADVSIEKFKYKKVPGYKYLVVSIYYHLSGKEVSILCNEEDFDNKKVVLYNNKGVIKELEKHDKTFGDYDGDYGTASGVDNGYISADYRK